MERVKRAICRAQPNQLVTITQVGDDWQTVRKRIARVRYRCAQLGQPLDWCWVVEQNPRRTGHHVHGVRRGPWMEWHVLNAACEREGVGFPWLTPVTTKHDPAAYIFKYMSKGIRLGSLDEFLRLNGRRFVHTSRGFWTDDHGRPCSFRDARRGDGTWTLVFEGEPATKARDAERRHELDNYLRGVRPALDARAAADAEIEDAAARIATGLEVRWEVHRPVDPPETLAARARRGGAFAGFKEARAAMRRRREADERREWWGGRPSSSAAAGDAVAPLGNSQHSQKYEPPA